MYVLEDLWGGKVNLHEKGFPSKQYARAMQRLANCGEKLLAVLNDKQDRPLAERGRPRRRTDLASDHVKIDDECEKSFYLTLSLLPESVSEKGV